MKSNLLIKNSFNKQFTFSKAQRQQQMES